VVWVFALSFSNLNTYNDNAGDQVRNITLLYLMLCPCGAAWSLDRLLGRFWWGRGGRLGRLLGRPPGPVFVYPWALRLLVVQMGYIYFVNGISKLFGEDWRSGYSLYYVLNDVTLARWSYTQFPIPIIITQLLSWSVLMWEVGFPFFMMLPWWMSRILPRLGAGPATTRQVVAILAHFRTVCLFFGVAFHLGIFLALELGWFGLYMICLYLPFVPWERWVDRRAAQVSGAGVGFSTAKKSA
jgi:hypothetical protein